MTGAGALVEILNGYGVEHIFCSPGSEWPPLWEELARRRAQGERAPEYLNVRHEEVAVAMASGYAKATGRLSAVIVHTTVGTLHAGMAMRAAYHEELPMLVCAGESIDFGEQPGFDPGGQWIRYLADRGGPARFAEPCVKWCMGVISRPTLASTLHRACQIAMTPPRGPVFVSLPFEFVFEEAIGPLPTSYPRAALSCADADLLEQAALILASSRRPLIITDAAGRDVEAVGEIVRLAELIAAPVIESTRQMYFNFPRDHPLHGGVDPRPYLDEADAVLLVGAVAPWHPPSAGPTKAARIVALDTNPLRPDLPYSGYRVDLLLTGEIGISLAGLVERLHGKLRGGDSGRQGRLKELKARHEQQREQWRRAARTAANVTPIDPRWLCHVLNRVLPHGAAVVEETITHRVPIVSLLDRLSPGRYYGAESGGLGLGRPQMRRPAPAGRYADRRRHLQLQSGAGGAWILAGIWPPHRHPHHEQCRLSVDEARSDGALSARLCGKDKCVLWLADPAQPAIRRDCAGVRGLRRDRRRSCRGRAGPAPCLRGGTLRPFGAHRCSPFAR
jgi:acetolactate synthase-1/2/3 large subunit